jgi:hypothetical protein
MEGTPAVYLGRIVKKENFRAFIYGTNAQKKLIESWDEFEAHMESGVWFATLEQANEVKAGVEAAPHEPKAKSKSKPKSKSKTKSEPVLEVNDSEDVLPDDGSVFEVTDEF